MSKTVVRKNESLDDALRRFKRAVTKAGTLQETRKREFYEKPSVKRKRFRGINCYERVYKRISKDA